MRQVFLMIVAVVCLFSLSGCHSFRNVTADELRSEEHLYCNFEINKSTKEIETSLYEYNNKCRPIVNGSFIVNPKNQKEAVIFMTLPGWSDLSVIVVMDFKEIDNSKTLVRAYRYYSTWDRHIDKIVQAINTPDKCN